LIYHSLTKQYENILYGQIEYQFPILKGSMAIFISLLIYLEQKTEYRIIYRRTKLVFKSLGVFLLINITRTVGYQWFDGPSFI
jgi:hypothetical protein